MTLAIKQNNAFSNNTSSKSGRLEARVSSEQKYLFQQAANLLGRSLTDFVISALQETSLKVIQDYAVLKLIDQDRQVFIQSLMLSPPPNQHLIKAKQRYQKTVISK